MLRFALFGLLLAASACASDQQKKPCSAAVESCDTAQRECQKRLIEALACMRGQSNTAQFSVEGWSAQKFVQQSTDSAGSLSEEQQLLLARQEAAFALFRLAPAQWNPVQSAASYVQTVPAFYDPQSKQIVIVRDDQSAEVAVPDDGSSVSEAGAGMPEAGSGTLEAGPGTPDAGASTKDAGSVTADAGAPGDQAASDANLRVMTHELTHVLRDEQTGLQAFYSRAGTTFDRLLVARSIVEGEAQLYAERAVREAHGESLDQVALEDVLAQLKRDTLKAFEATDEPIGQADRFLTYPYGFTYVLAAYEKGGAKAIDRIYREPPVSTRQLTAGFAAPEPFGGAWSEDADLARLAAPVLPDTYELLGAFEMGVWLVDAFVQRTLPVQSDDLSWRVLSAMRSDALSLFHERERDTPLAVWRMRFADAASAQAMLELAAWPEAIEVHRDDRDVIFLAAPSLDERALLAQLRFGSTPTTPSATMQSGSALGVALAIRLISAGPSGLR